MQLGGAAATRFAAKPKLVMHNAYAAAAAAEKDSTTAAAAAASNVYQTSDQVREYYYKLKTPANDGTLKAASSAVVVNGDEEDEEDEEDMAAQKSTSCSSSNSNSSDYVMIPSDDDDTSTKATSLPTTSTTTTLPPLWENRQKERDIQARQYGVFSSRMLDAPTPQRRQEEVVPAKEGQPRSAVHVALVQLATHTLETLAVTLDPQQAQDIPEKDRQAFADAIRQAMQAMT